MRCGGRADQRSRVGVHSKHQGKGESGERTDREREIERERQRETERDRERDRDTDKKR